MRHIDRTGRTGLVMVATAVAMLSVAAGTAASTPAASGVSSPPGVGSPGVGSPDARWAPLAGVPQRDRIRPDFDGDGYADLAVGAPGTDVRGRNSGAVHVFYGGPTGLRAGSRKIWHLNSPGIAGRAQRGAQFGWSVADGDFDGDGFSDLAVSARWERAGARKAGAVHVLYGSPSGLSAVRAQRWHQNLARIPSRSRQGDEFGWAMAAGDLDGDGRDDLAVAALGKDVGSARDAGSVHVLYGTARGLSARRSQLWHQDRAGLPGRAETGDAFGKAIAVGDFDGDGRDDLAIGVPYEDRRIDRVGVVHVIYGTRNGLAARGSQVWHQDSPGIAERAELRDQFGQSLTSGDIDGNGRDDLVVGVWYEDYLNDLSNEGGFHVIYGRASGLQARGNQFWHQDRRGVLDRTRISDRFGQALASGALDGDGYADVIVGTPSSDLSGGVHMNQGAVHIFRGGRAGLHARGDRYLTQAMPGVIGAAEAQDHFGTTVGAADFNADGKDDLVVGIPFEDLRARDDGAVYIVPGSARGPDLRRDRQLSAGSRRWLRKGDLHFGWSLTGSVSDDGSARLGSPKV